MGLFHKHEWEFVSAEPFYYEGDFATGHKTRLLYQCKSCCKYKTNDIWGRRFSKVIEQREKGE